jgi:hypothetical protein
VRRVVKRLTALIAVVALLSATALLVQRGRATAAAPPNHDCPSVTTLDGFGHGHPLVVQTRNVSCTEALTVIRAMVSGVGVTFSGNPDNASSFRWKLYGLPGWTCFGDGSGFPGHGAGGDCTNGAATVEWYHA